MGIDTILVILLVWTVAGLLAAIAFGKTIQETSPDEEEGLAASAGSVKYIRRNKTKSRNVPGVSSDSPRSSNSSKKTA